MPPCFVPVAMENQNGRLSLDQDVERFPGTTVPILAHFVWKSVRSSHQPRETLHMGQSRGDEDHADQVTVLYALDTSREHSSNPPSRRKEKLLCQLLLHYSPEQEAPPEFRNRRLTQQQYHKRRHLHDREPRDHQ